MTFRSSKAWWPGLTWQRWLEERTGHQCWGGVGGRREKRWRRSSKAGEGDSCMWAVAFLLFLQQLWDQLSSSGNILNLIKLQCAVLSLRNLYILWFSGSPLISLVMSITSTWERERGRPLHCGCSWGFFYFFNRYKGLLCESKDRRLSSQPRPCDVTFCLG